MIEISSEACTKRMVKKVYNVKNATEEQNKVRKFYRMMINKSLVTYSSCFFLSFLQPGHEA